MVKFAPKSEEQLRKEIIEAGKFDPDNETNKEIIDGLVSLRLKDEEFKASLHKDKKNHKHAKNFYKETMEKAGFDPKTGKPKEQPKGSETNTNNLDEAKVRQMMAEERFLSEGYDEKDLEVVKKVMAVTGKSMSEAKKDDIFALHLEKREREDSSRSSQLPASRGGSLSIKKTEEDKIAERNQGNLPPGFVTGNK